MSAARELALKARAASRKLQAMTTEERVAMLHRVADAIVANEAVIMEENAKVRAGSLWFAPPVFFLKADRSSGS